MRTALIGCLFAVTAAFAAAAPAENSEEEFKEKILKLNKDITEKNANDRLKEFNKDKVNTAKMVKFAAKMLKNAKDGEKPVHFYPALVLAKAAQLAKDHDAAAILYQYATDYAIDVEKEGELVALAGLSQIDFYLSGKQYGKAIKVCDRLLEEDYKELKGIGELKIYEKKLRAMARDGQGDAAIEMVNELIDDFRGNILFKNLKAGLLRDCAKYDEAVTLYKELIEEIDKNAKMDDDDKKFFTNSFRYALSGVYTELDKLDDATGELEKLMKENPDNPTFKNDLGFLWADNDKNLEKSEKLIREAIELDLKENKKLADEGKLDPELAKKANPAYVDSLGWVLYKNKKYDEAIKHLLQSAGSDDEESDHIEIWDHVGDCYLALGKKKEALEAFQRGLKSEDVTKKDAERRKRVTEKITKLKKEMN